MMQASGRDSAAWIRCPGPRPAAGGAARENFAGTPVRGVTQDASGLNPQTRGVRGGPSRGGERSASGQPNETGRPRSGAVEATSDSAVRSSASGSFFNTASAGTAGGSRAAVAVAAAAIRSGAFSPLNRKATSTVSRC